MWNLLGEGRERERERERESGIDLNVILLTESSFYLHEVNECSFRM